MPSRNPCRPDDQYKKTQPTVVPPPLIHTSSWTPLHLRKKPTKWGKKSLNLWRRPALLNWLKTIKMEPRVHLEKEVAFRLQETAIADSLSPVIWENCLLSRTNTGRNQQHTSALEDRWGPFPCTFQPIASMEVFSTGSFFSSSRAGV